MRLSRYIFNNHQDITDNEKRACLLLKVMSNSNINEYFVEYEESGKSNDSFSEYLKQIKKPIATESESQYINCNFILENVVEVEYLWNTAGYILRDERTSMGSENFEAPCLSMEPK